MDKSKVYFTDFRTVISGRPSFHISLITDVSPNCDCHGENDAPILPNQPEIYSPDDWETFIIASYF
ncbi:MAG: hypothetical protein K6E91_09715 [Butyrivibrio sp.]|nr:hypothetical protein [Butyrivibrio sp.]